MAACVTSASTSSKRSLRLLAAFAVVPASMVCPISRAATIYWDGGSANITTNGDGISQGGAGTWSRNISNWDRGAGLSHVTSAAKDDVIFGGTAGVVSLVDNRTVNGVSFAVDGYTVTSTTKILKIGSGGITVNGGTTLNVLLSLNAAQSWTVAAGKTLTVGGALTTAGNRLAIAGAGNTSISGVISGTGGITMSGSGMLTLSGANTYSGSTNLIAGILRLGSTQNGTTSGPLGTGSILFTGGTLQYSTANSADYSSRFSTTGGQTWRIDTNGINVTYAAALTGASSLIKLGTGTLTLTGATTFTGGTTVSAGTLALGTSSNRLADTGAVTIDGASAVLALGGFSDTVGTVTVRSGGSITGTGSLTGSSYQVESGAIGAILAGSGALTKNTAGTVTLSAVNSYTGGTTISAGRLIVTGNLSNTGAVMVNGGTYTVSANDTIGALTLNSGTIDGTGTLTATSYTVNSGLISASLAGGAATLVKNTVGTVVLSGINAYGGSTTINAGTLSVNGSVAATSSVLVSSGATLSGTGVAEGVVTVAAGGIVTAGTGTSGTLTVGNLAFTGTGTLNIGSLSNYTTASALNVTGSLTASGLVTITLPSEILSNGIYLIASHANTLADLTKFTVAGGTLGARQSGVLLNDIGVIKYVVSGDAPKWTGAISGAWDTSTRNWRLITGGGTTTYMAGDALLFDDTATGFTRIVIDAAVAPTAVTFANATKHYTISGTAGIAAGSLTKLGTGTLTITNANTYAGGTTLNAGVLEIGNNSALGTGTLHVNGGVVSSDSGAARSLANSLALGSDLTVGDTVNTGALAFSGSVNLGGSTRTIATVSDLTLSGAVSAGGIVKTGTGTLILSGTNTYTGGTTLTAGTLAVNSAAALGDASGTFTVAGNATLRFDAGITFARGMTVEPGATASVNTNSKSVTISGVIAGSGALTKTGAGTLTLSGANTFLGTTAIDAGTLALAGGAALPDTAFVTLANVSGATLRLNASETIGALGGGGALGGSVDLQSYALTVAGATDSAFSGIIAGTGSLVKSGASTLTLSGANSYSGSTTISGGTLAITADAALGAAPGIVTPGSLVLAGGTLAANATFTLTTKRGITTGGTIAVADGATLTYGGTAAGSGSLTKSGSGALVLTGANDYTGATAVNAGTLLVHGSLNSNSSVTIAGGATLGGTGIIGGAVTVGDGASLIAGNGTSGFLTIGGDLTFAGDGAIAIGKLADYTGAAAIQVSGGLILQDAAASIVFNLPTGNLASGTYRLISQTGGLNGAQFAVFSVTGGTVGIRQTANLVNNGGNIDYVVSGATPYWTGAVGDAWDTTSNNWMLTGSSIVTKFLATNDVVLFDDNATGTTAVTIAANVSPVSTTFNNATKAYTLSGAAGIAAGSLTKSGAGALTISNTNTYAGGTTLNAGVLRLGNNAALGTGLVALNGGTLSSVGVATRVLSNALMIGGDITLGNATDPGLLAFTGSVDLGGATRRITAASALNFSGTISNGGLAVVGTGLVTLTGTNTYTAGTTIDTGASLSLGDGWTDGAIANGTAIVANGTFTYNQRGNHAYAHLISGSGSLVKSGAGTLTLTTENTFAGTVLVTDGGLRLGDGVNDGSLAFATSVANDGTLTYEITGNHAYANVISGTGSLVKSGAGTLTLAGTNSYTGGTTITDGTLRIGNGTTDGSIAATAGIVNSGTLEYNIVGSRTYANVISGTGSLVKSGAGTLTLTGLNTYNGATVIRAGTLQIGDGVTDGSIVGTSGIHNDGTLAYAVVGSRLYDKVISGTGALIKTGAGMLTLTGANTYAGGTTVSGGVLQVGDGMVDGVLGSGTVSLGAGAKLFANISGEVTYTQDISGDGGLTKTGAGTLILTGFNTFKGGMTLAGGTVAVHNAQNLGDLNTSLIYAADSTLKSLATRDVLRGWDIHSGVTATIDTNGYDVNIKGVIEGAGSLRKIGGGTLTVANALSTYTGLTTIAGGTLQVGDGTINGNLSNSSGILNNAALIFNIVAATTPTYAKVISGTGTLEKTGVGTLQLTGANTYAGATAITAGTLQIGDGVTDGSLLGTSVITVASGATMSFNTVGTTVNNRVIGGSGDVVKLGSGTHTLSGANTYTGTTTIAAGTLKLGSGTALGGTGAGAVVSSGATLDLNGQTVGAESLTLAGDGVGSLGALVNNDGTAASLSGAITLTAATRVGGVGNLTLGGAIGGASTGLTKVGGGILTLTGASTYTGSTSLEAGTLVVNGSLASGSAVSVASGTILAGSGTIGGSVSVASGGTITVGDGSAGTLAIGGNLNFSGAGTIRIGEFRTDSSPLVVTGAITLAGGSGAVVLDLHPGSLANGTYHLISQGDAALSVSGFSTHGLPFSGLLTRQAGVIVNNNGMINLVVTGDNPVWTGATGSAWDATTDNNWKLIVGGGSTRFITDDVVLFNDSATGTTTVDIAASVATTAVNFDNSFKNYTLQGAAGITSGALTKAGTGTLTITNANTYAGGTMLHGGVLEVGNNAALGTGLLELHQGKLSSDSGNARTLGNTVAIGGDITLGDATRNGALTFGSASLIDLGGGARRITTLSDVTVSNFINGSYIKDGAGTLTITQSTTSPLDITINAGTLSIGAISVGTSASSLIFSGNGKLLITAAVTAGGNRNFVINSGVTATVETNYAVTNGGVISGAGSLTKTGSGTLILTAANSYTGLTTVSGGVLQLGNGTTDGSIATGSGIVNNAALIYNLVGDHTYAKAISGTGTLTKTGSGTLTLTGANSYTGTTTISGGALKIGDGVTDGSLTGGTVIVNNGALIYDIIGDSACAHSISGTGTVLKAGSGTLTLSGFNTFGGGMTIADGTVAVGAAGSLGRHEQHLTFAGNSTLKTLLDREMTREWIINSGVTATVDTGDHVVTLSGLIEGEGSLTKIGAGRLTLGNAGNTYTGVTTIREGTLVISSDGALGAAPTAATPGKLVLDGGTLAINAAVPEDITIDANRGIRLLRTSTIEVAAGTEVVYAGTVAGTGGFIKTGGGTLELYGRNTFNGGVRLREGTLEINDALSLGNSIGGDLIFEGNATLKATEHPVPIFENRIYTINTGFTATIDTNGNTLTHSGLINGAGALTKGGEGTLTITGTAAHTGATMITAGVLRLDRLASDNAAVSASDITIDGGTLMLAHGEQIADSRSVALNSGVFEFEGAGLTETLNALTLAGGTLNTGANTLSVQSLYLTGGAASVSAGGTLVVRAGADGLTFGGSDSPVLALGSSATAPGTLLLNSNVTVGATLTSGTALILGVGRGRELGVGEVLRSGVVDLGGGVRTFTINDGSAATDMEVAAAITNGGLVKSGAGTLALTGNNLYAGDTTINAGTLEIGGSGTLGAGAYAGAIANEGTLRFSTTADNHLSGTISGSGAMIKSGTGTLTLTGLNSHTGLTTITGGVLEAGSLSALGGSRILVSGGGLTTRVSNFRAAALDMNSGDSHITINDVATGVIALVSDGDFTVLAGTLHVDIADLLDYDRIVGDGGNFTFDGGTLSLNGFSGFEGTGTVGNSYALISGFSVAGNRVSGLNIVGYDRTNWWATLNTDGMLVFTSIPEPSTWGLIGAGTLCAIAAMRRRRSRP